MSFCRFVFAPPNTSASPLTGGVPPLQFPPTDQRLFTAPVHVFVAALAEAATSSNAIARRRTEFMMTSIRTAGETRWGNSGRDLPRHAEAPSELVVDEVRDPAAAVALAASFAVEARGTRASSPREARTFCCPPASLIRSEEHTSDLQSR